MLVMMYVMSGVLGMSCVHRCVIAVVCCQGCVACVPVGVIHESIDGFGQWVVLVMTGYDPNIKLKVFGNVIPFHQIRHDQLTLGDIMEQIENKYMTIVMKTINIMVWQVKFT